MGSMISLGLRGAATLRSERKRNLIVVDGGAGIGYTLGGDAPAGRLFNLDGYLQLDRYTLRKSPTISAITATVARMFRSLRLELRRANGDDVANHVLLDLLNEFPNEVHSPSEFWYTVAEELVHGGECIIRVHRDGATPRRLVVWPYEETHVEPPVNVTYSEPAICCYRYRNQIVDVVPGQPPPVCHVRMSIDHHRPLRAEDPWRGLHSEILSSIYASVYRSEYFRQGGSPRLVATMDASDGVDTGSMGDAAVAEEQSKMDAVWQAIKAGLSAWAGGRATRLPAGVSMQDFGPKSSEDPILAKSARAVDEKLAAAAGVPLIALNNMERSTYSNSRQQQAVLVRDAIQPRVDALLSALKRDLLIPMGGRNARLVPVVNTDILVQDEAVVFNKIVMDRLKAGVISTNEAREALGLAPDPEFDDEDPGAMPDDPADADEQDDTDEGT